MGAKQATQMERKIFGNEKIEGPGKWRRQMRIFHMEKENRGQLWGDIFKKLEMEGPGK